MEKPLSIVIEETKDNIIKILYESNLIPILAEKIIKEIYDDVSMVVRQQYSNDLKEYNNYIESQAANNKNDEELSSEEV